MIRNEARFDLKWSVIAFLLFIITIFIDYYFELSKLLFFSIFAIVYALRTFVVIRLANGSQLKPYKYH